MRREQCRHLLNAGLIGAHAAADRKRRPVHPDAVAALDRVVLKLRRHGAEVEVIGLNQASESLVDRLGTHRDSEAGLSAGH